MSELTVSIRTIDDELTEATETLVLELSVLSGPAVTGAVDRVTVSIVDDDEAPVVPELPEVVVVTATLRVSELSVSEGDTATLNIELSEAASEDVTLTLTVVGGSADESVDYEPLLVPVVIRAGVLELTVSIRTIDDDVTEATETLVLELSVLSGPAVTGAVDRVTVTIIDDDEAPVVPELPEMVVVTATLRVSELSVSEGDTATLNIELSEAASEDVTLTLTVVAGGSADVMVDYEPLLVPVVIRAGLSELTVSIRTIDDDVTEATETLVLELSVLSGPAVTGAVDRVTVSILDDDALVVPEPPELVVVTATLSTDRLSVEESRLASFTVRLSKASEKDLAFTLTRISGTALEVEDYSLPVMPIVVSAGDLGVTVTISVLSDATYELTETVEFALTPTPGSNVNLGTPSELTLEIEERFAEQGDLLNRILSFEMNDVETCGDEPNTLNICVETDIGTYSEPLGLVLRDASSRRDTLEDLPDGYNHLDGDSSLVDIYFVNGDGEVVSRLNNEVIIRISLSQDVVESLGGPDRISFGVLHSDASDWELPSTTYRLVGTEYIFETLSDRFSLFGLLIRAELRPTVEIGFDSLTYSVEENVERVELTVSVLSGVLMETVTLSYATLPGSAIGGGADYIDTMDTLTLSEMTTSVTFDVTIINDDVMEPNKMFTVSLSGAPSGITLDPAIALVTILDSDAPPVADDVGFAVTSASVEEGEIYEIELELVDRSGNLLSHSSDVSVTLEVYNAGTTLDSAEYRFTRTVTIPAGETVVKLEFRSVDDAVVESEEMIVIRIAETQQVGSRSGYDMLTLSVIDDDAELGFSATTYSASEGAGGVTITLDIAGRLTEDVTLNYEIASGTASETEDYVAPLTREIPLSSGATRATLFVEIVNDDLYENADMFSVRLVEPDGGLPFGIELVTAYTETVVTIINDDEIEIGFVEGMYTFLENQRRGTAQVRYSGSEIAPGVEVLVYYSTTVEIGDSIDINDVSGTLVLSSNNRVYNINFPITDDNAFNRDTERYTVSLGTFDMNSGLTFRLDRVSASLNVLTDDVLDFGFSVTDYEVNEGSGTVELEVSVLRNTIGAGERVVVIYSTTPGSATSSDPSDFEPVTGEVILSSMATSVTFAIPITDDDILEDSESFVVTLRKADGRDTLRLSQSEATVTILDDNDPVTVGFGSASYSVREDRSAVLDVGVLSGGLERDITVSYDIRGGSAVAGVDYEYMTGTVTLSSDASETLSISLLEDNIFDPGETFTVVLTGHDGPSAVTLGLSEAVVRIDDNELRPTVDLEEIVDVSEGETVTVIARLSGELSVPVELTLGPSDADYQITLPTLVIPAGDLTVAFELIAIDDNRFEGVEVKTVELSVSDNVVGLGDGVQSFMILDAQSRSSLALDPVTAVEEGDERIVTVRLNRALESTLTVTVSTTEAIGLTRATNAIDYRLSSDSIRIPVGALMATFTLEALPDDLYEGDEEFRLVLTPVGELVDFGTLTRTVTILDEDLVTVGFETVEYVVVEGGLSVTVVVVADRQAVRDEIRLGYETVDGSARASDNDYIASRGEIVLSSGTIRETIEIFIPEDDVFEYDEEFTVVLGAPAGGLASFVSIELSRAVARVTVENDDELTVGFEETAYRVSEGATKIELLVVVLSGSIGDGTEIEVPYSVVASTAEAGSDYEVVSDMVTLGSSGTSAIEVLITDDSAFEYDETFTVVLAAPVGVMLSATATVTDVTIEDDDTVVIGFERATYVVDEDSDSGEVELTVAVLNGSLGDTVTLNYVTADGTAVAGEDYTALSSSLTLSSDMSRATFMVSIIDDVLFETDELFRVSLSGAPVRVALNLSSAEVTIVNDDTVELGFESAVYSVSEGAGEVTVSVRVVSGVLGDDLTLNYAMVAGTAVSGEDYDSSSGMLTLSPGATEMTFTVSIIEDALFETDEKFSVVLSGAPSGVILTVDTAEVTIEDDDLVTIGFGLSSYLILENGGQLEVVVEVKDGTLAAGVSVTVVVSTEDGTALAPGDYVATVETEVLSSTNLQRAVNIPINLDRLIEGTEEFSVVLSLPEGDSLSDRVILDPISAPVSISDEVIVTIGFVDAPYEVSEGAGGVSVTVSILSEGVMPGAGVTLSVDYVLSDGSAIIGEDYSSISGTVSFAGETSTQEIFIPITDDNLFEGSESFTITLSVSSASIGPDAPALQLNPQETYVTIVDDDEVVIGFQRDHVQGI